MGRNHIFQRSIAEPEGKPTYTFYEGPPTANGKPDIHPVVGRAIMDIFFRYKTTGWASPRPARRD